MLMVLRSPRGPYHTRHGYIGSVRVGGSERPAIRSDSMHESTHTTATRHAPRIAPMVALARGLGAACQISVARLRPAESDVRGRPSTWSETFGAVRQVRGGAEAGFWVVCWVARGGARQLAAAWMPPTVVSRWATTSGQYLAHATSN